MAHYTHNTRYSDSSHYDERCILCGATDAPGSNGLDIPCREYSAEEIGAQVAPTQTNCAFRNADSDAIVARILIALNPSKKEVFSTDEEGLSLAVRAALEERR